MLSVTTSRCCSAQLKPIQPASWHVPITDENYTDEESARAVAARPSAVKALKAAAKGMIYCPDASAAWASADIRLLRIHRLLKEVGVRCDGSAKLVITDYGEDCLPVLRQIV